MKWPGKVLPYHNDDYLTPMSTIADDDSSEGDIYGSQHTKRWEKEEQVETTRDLQSWVLTP